MRSGLTLEGLGPLAWGLLLLSVLSWVVLLFGAKASRHRRYQQQARRVLERLPLLEGDGQRLAYLRKINPYVFEELLLTAFELRGYRIKRNRRYSGDGGLDGQVWIDGQRYLIQAKRYGRAITPTHVAEFGALVRREGCRGLFVHTGRTGPKSRAELARIPEIELLSGQRLLALLKKDIVL
ncbi:restriction endonuclease [Serratia fonticola]|uniref:Restriction endonuclease n=1 Tax=Serratia fonticola TaxID=47917 RepID=A0AAW3WKN0_SERFO|nr:restriction endonuclease [Serratia fonticola]MBC3211061.1 restriction endonuclease [Serratia fonticola]NYA12043.1 restriction endonuclease [Serratia fonticola]NYA31622.1 restriction endonuclease [Serratia fonticola]